MTLTRAEVGHGPSPAMARLVHGFAGNKGFQLATRSKGADN